MNTKMMVVVTLMFASTASAQSGDRLSPECRREIVRMCGINRDGLRDCLFAKARDLTPECRQQLARRAGGQAGQAQAQSLPPSEALSYGSHARQQIALWKPVRSARPTPLFIFVHGGGWSMGDMINGAGSKPQAWTGRGYAFASVNYRLVPEVNPEAQARDIAAAVARLRDTAGAHGIDPNRIIVSGHSAGAHLAALIASDTRYLEAAGVPANVISHVVLLDGAGYDVARQIGSPGNLTRQIYSTAFGTDPAFQAHVSPLLHAAAPNAGRWLLLHVDKRADSKAQAGAFAAALKKSGTEALVVSIPNATHMSVNTDAGKPGTLVFDEIVKFVSAD